MGSRPLFLLLVLAAAASADEAAPGGTVPAAEPAADPMPKVMPVPFDPARDGQAAADCLAYAEIFSESVLDGTLTLQQDPTLWDTFDEANRAGALLEKAMEAIAASKGTEATRDLAKDTAARYRQQLAAARQSTETAQRSMLARDLADKTHACAARAAGWSAAEGWADSDDIPVMDETEHADGKDLP